MYSIYSFIYLMWFLAFSLELSVSKNQTHLPENPLVRPSEKDEDRFFFGDAAWLDPWLSNEKPDLSCGSNGQIDGYPGVSYGIHVYPTACFWKRFHATSKSRKNSEICTTAACIATYRYAVLHGRCWYSKTNWIHGITSMTNRHYLRAGIQIVTGLLGDFLSTLSASNHVR